MADIYHAFDLSLTFDLAIMSLTSRALYKVLHTPRERVATLRARMMKLGFRNIDPYFARMYLVYDPNRAIYDEIEKTIHGLKGDYYVDPLIVDIIITDKLLAQKGRIKDPIARILLSLSKKEIERLLRPHRAPVSRRCEYLSAIKAAVDEGPLTENKQIGIYQVDLYYPGLNLVIDVHGARAKLGAHDCRMRVAAICGALRCNYVEVTTREELAWVVEKVRRVVRLIRAVSA